jgi:hypothetical protein
VKGLTVRNALAYCGVELIMESKSFIKPAEEEVKAIGEEEKTYFQK